MTFKGVTDKVRQIGTIVRLTAIVALLLPAFASPQAKIIATANTERLNVVMV